MLYQRAHRATTDGAPFYEHQKRPGGAATRTPGIKTEGFKMVDRSEVSRALAKALAYKACGKQEDAEKWAARLVRLLECGGILRNGGAE